MDFDGDPNDTLQREPFYPSGDVTGVDTVSCLGVAGLDGESSRSVAVSVDFLNIGMGLENGIEVSDVTNFEHNLLGENDVCNDIVGSGASCAKGRLSYDLFSTSSSEVSVLRLGGHNVGGVNEGSACVNFSSDSLTNSVGGVVHVNDELDVCENMNVELLGEVGKEGCCLPGVTTDVPSVSGSSWDFLCSGILPYLSSEDDNFPMSGFYDTCSSMSNTVSPCDGKVCVSQLSVSVSNVGSECGPLASGSIGVIVGNSVVGNGQDANLNLCTTSRVGLGGCLCRLVIVDNVVLVNPLSVRMGILLSESCIVFLCRILPYESDDFFVCCCESEGISTSSSSGVFESDHSSGTCISYLALTLSVTFLSGPCVFPGVFGVNTSIVSGTRSVVSQNFEDLSLRDVRKISDEGSGVIVIGGGDSSEVQRSSSTTMFENDFHSSVASTGMHNIGGDGVGEGSGCLVSSSSVDDTNDVLGGSLGVDVFEEGGDSAGLRCEGGDDCFGGRIGVFSHSTLVPNEIPGGFVNLTGLDVPSHVSTLLSFGPRFVPPAYVTLVDCVEAGYYCMT